MAGEYLFNTSLERLGAWSPKTIKRWGTDAGCPSPATINRVLFVPGHRVPHPFCRTLVQVDLGHEGDQLEQGELGDGEGPAGPWSVRVLSRPCLGGGSIWSSAQSVGCEVCWQLVFRPKGSNPSLFSSLITYQRLDPPVWFRNATVCPWPPAPRSASGSRTSWTSSRCGPGSPW